ncbi:MAG: response regulator [Sphingobacteriales bacterium]|nr:response regulator [Sphingobacteriales bacterium]OJY91077.1 MAG: hypothetical protein BGP14_06715 [Sphingobacteriales bacterium 44-15]
MDSEGNHNTNRPLVMFADDDPDLLRLAKMRLTTEGFNVKLCPNGENIIPMAASEKPDVILLDLKMDNTDGRDICLSLKADKRTTDIPVIFISANNDLENIARLYGADGFIHKPFSIHSIKEKIEGMLSAGAA